MRAETSGHCFIVRREGAEDRYSFESGDLPVRPVRRTGHSITIFWERECEASTASYMQTGSCFCTREQPGIQSGKQTVIL